MKQQDMIKKIAKFISENTPTPEDRCEETATQLLDMIEDEGMLPPIRKEYNPNWQSSSITDSGIFNDIDETGKRIYYVNVNEWDEE